LTLQLWIDLKRNYSGLYRLVHVYRLYFMRQILDVVFNILFVKFHMS